MKNKGKYITLFVILIMLANMIAACSLNTADTSKTTDSSKTTTQSQTQSQTVENFNLTGYPIVKEPVTISVMGPRSAVEAVPWAENTAFAYLEELTNIKFDYRDIDSQAWNDKLSLTLASGDLPDMFFSLPLSFTRIQMKQNVDAGYFIPLNDLIDKYAPNVKSILENRPAIKQVIAFPDGTIPGLFAEANIVSEEAPVMPTTAIMIYQPWLDKLNLKMPTTTQEFYDVLVAFKNGDPNGNGIADEIPFSPRGGQGALYNLLNLFNISANRYNDCVYDYETGKVEYALGSDKYKDFLKYLRKLYQEKLLDNDIFTDTTAMTLAKGSQTPHILGASVASGPTVVVSEDRWNDMVPVPILESPYGERTWTRRAEANAYYFVLTKNNKYQKETMRLVDYLYSEDGARLAWMGIENQDWRWRDDGKWEFILNEGENFRTRRSYCSLQQTGIIAKFPVIYYTKTTDIGESQFVRFCQAYVDEPGEADLLLPQFPSLWLEEKQTQEIATYATDIGNYSKEMMAKFISGELDIDAEWNNYLATLERMKVNELVKILQGAADAQFKK